MMDRAALANEIADMIGQGRKHPLGIAGLLIDAEVKAGRKPTQPGQCRAFDFPADDWCFPVVVSLDGPEVRLVAIQATRPGNGALRRLVASILAAGLCPVIVCPVGPTMPAILTHWGWRRRTVNHGGEAVDEWRPRR